MEMNDKTESYFPKGHITQKKSSFLSKVLSGPVHVEQLLSRYLNESGFNQKIRESVRLYVCLVLGRLKLEIIDEAG